MAITKNQKSELETRFKNTWKTYNSLSPDDNLKELFKITIIEQEAILKILGYTREDFINLKNAVMEQYNFSLYAKYLDLQRLVNEITGQQEIFLYDIEVAGNLVESLDYDIKRIGELRNKLHYIKLEIESNNRIQQEFERKIKSMIA
jgi:hypothetical protein